jgi:hypothetical protein
MSDRVEACRLRAEDCERAALRVSDPKVQAAYRDMAQQWRVMADFAEAAKQGILAKLRAPAK